MTRAPSFALPPALSGARLALMLPAALLASACTQPLDYDLRGQIGGFSTAEAAQNVIEDRPRVDERGLITYPSYQVAVARRGDTVASLAARIGLPAEDIARYNGHTPSDPLRADEVLALPRRAPERVAKPTSSDQVSAGGVDIAALAGAAIDEAPARSPNPGSVTPVTPAPRVRAPAPEPIEVQSGPEPIQHKVTRGETAYTISRLYQVPVKALAEWNGLSSDFALREGQVLLIPLKEGTPPPVQNGQNSQSSQPAANAAPVALPAPEQTVVTAPGQGTKTPVPPSAAKPLPTEEVAPAATAAAALQDAEPAVEVQAPTRAAQSAMTYPVKGKIIRSYQKGKNDGIDISAPAGTPVVAAESGSVAAITEDSNKVPIVVLRHDNNLLSVYANVDGIQVKKGDRVARGQPIAELRAGDVAYVHFEIRDGFESVDPLPYLK